MAFKKTVLLKIHRKYGKNEAIQYLLKEVKQLSAEKAKVMNEAAELKQKAALLEQELIDVKRRHKLQVNNYEARLIGFKRHQEKLQNLLHQQNEKRMKG